MSRNTKNMPPAARSSGIIPTADSKISVRNITNWIMAGAGRRRAGRAGKPIDMLERERKTVV